MQKGAKAPFEEPGGKTLFQMVFQKTTRKKNVVPHMALQTVLLHPFAFKRLKFASFWSDIPLDLEPIKELNNHHS